MTSLELPKNVLQHKAFYHSGKPFVLPFIITLSVTERCNSACLTCNISDNAQKELSLNEYKRIFDSFGKILYWVTITGGEPFLRDDIDEICDQLYKKCKPAFITIPTNGTLPSTIENKVKNIIANCADLKLVVNASVDHIGKKQSNIRGINNNFESVLETFNRLKAIQANNLIIGINTTISKYNYSEIEWIQNEILQLEPDSFISEIAQVREELKNEKKDFVISNDQSLIALKKLLEKLKDRTKSTKITKAFRREYYRKAICSLARENHSQPCYAGFASCHIFCDGRVAACGVKPSLFGHLKVTDFSIKNLLASPSADKLRKKLKNEDCTCLMSNISYINSLFSMESLFRIGLQLVRNCFFIN
jgi:MoaA/NifB/PqqE/SkfB family radical SAM enzyme